MQYFCIHTHCSMQRLQNYEVDISSSARLLFLSFVSDDRNNCNLIESSSRLRWTIGVRWQSTLLVTPRTPYQTLILHYRYQLTEPIGSLFLRVHVDTRDILIYRWSRIDACPQWWRVSVCICTKGASFGAKGCSTQSRGWRQPQY